MVTGEPAPVPGTGRPPPAARPAEPALDKESLQRLGRFLSTFGWIAALAATADCATPLKSGELTPELQTQVEIAEQHLAHGRFAEAVQTLTPVIEESPRAHVALHEMGLAYVYLGRWSDAEGYLRRAVDAEPKYSIAKNTLANLLIEQRRCGEAVPLLEEVQKDIFYATPELAEHNLARAEHCLGKSKEAMRRLENLVLRRPQFCRGYLTLADVAAEAKVPEVTIRACEHFTAQCEQAEDVKKYVSPEHSCLCYLRKGLAYAALGDVEAARQSLSSCESDGAYGRECRRSLQLLESTEGRAIEP
jgi:predicted Zn-dependent protease